MQFFDLPPEIISHIFSFLNLNDLSLLINKKLFHLQKNILIKHKTFKFKNIPSQFYNQIRKLRVGGCDNIDFSLFNNLIELDISGNNLEKKDAQHISKLINLQKLDIWNNNLGDEGAKHLSNLNHLQILDISDNNLGDEGAQHLSKLINCIILH